MTTQNSVNTSLSGQTGTASFVGSTAPTFTTSWKYAATGFNILDNNGNAQITFTTTASAVNYLQIANAATAGNPIISATGTDANIGINLVAKGLSQVIIGNNTGANNIAYFTSSPGTIVNYLGFNATPTLNAPSIFPLGTDTNILLQLSGKGTSGVGVQGTSTNDNAVAGNVGEYKSTVVLVANQVNLSSGATVNIVTLSLTAGDWDVWGELWTHGPSGTSYTLVQAGITTTSATLPAVPADGTSLSVAPLTAAAVVGSNVTPIIDVGIARISISTTTTVYLVCNSNFSVHIATGWGKLAARRVR